MKQFLLFILALYSISVQLVGVDGQLSTKTVDSFGNDFILSFLRNMFTGRNAVIQLHMTASTEFTDGVEVNIEYPVGTFYQSTRLFSRNVTIVSLPTQASSGWTTNTVQRNSIRVYSSDATQDFLVYMVNYEQFSSDAALAIPIDALNTKYIVVDYPSFSPEFVVTAAYDDTLITITPTATIGPNAVNVPFTVSLDHVQMFRKMWIIVITFLKLVRLCSLGGNDSLLPPYHKD